MSLISELIDQNPERTKRLLGIEYEPLQQLISQAELADKQIQAKNEESKERVNAPGGGRKSTLSDRDEILLTLTYLRQHPTFEWLGLNFGVSESTAHSIFHHWIQILLLILPPSLLEQSEKAENLEDIKDILIVFELIVDTFEQARQRPQDKEERKEFYSGYKHNYTFKNIVTVLPKGRDIIDVNIGNPGPKADIDLFRERQDNFNSKQKFKGDKAFVGEENISTLHKKPKNQELTEEEEKENKEFSSQRVFVEHVIRLIRIFRISQQTFRLRSRHYEQVISVICGLVRFRMGRFSYEV